MHGGSESAGLQLVRGLERQFVAAHRFWHRYFFLPTSGGGNHKRYIFRVDSDEEADSWVACIEIDIAREQTVVDLYKDRKLRQTPVNSPGSVASPGP